MVVYLTLTAFVLVMALMVRRSQLNTCKQGKLCISRNMTRQDVVNMILLVMIFSCLFWVSALRVNVGNDYAKYVEFMHLVYSHAYVPTEVGFNVLTYVIYYLSGFENFILVFAVFAFFTVFFFMKALWEQSDWFPFSFMMFMFLGYYFQSISTVRYYLALALALYSVKYVAKDDWPRFVLVVLVGALFHKSMLVVLVLYPLARLNWKRWLYVAGVLGCISCLFLQDFYLKVLLKLYPSYKDTEYLTGGTSYVNIVRCACILVLSLLLYKDVIQNNRKWMFCHHCNIMALALYVFGSFLPVISRIGYYLTVTHLLMVPALILGIRDEKKKNLLAAVVVLGCVIYFAKYMMGASNDGVRILPYQTIMFNDMPMILSERGY